MKFRLPLSLYAALLALFALNSTSTAADLYRTLSAGSSSWEAASAWSTTSGGTTDTTWNSATAATNAHITSVAGGSTLTLAGAINVEALNLLAGSLTLNGGSLAFSGTPQISLAANTNLTIGSAVTTTGAVLNVTGGANTGVVNFTGNVHVKGAFNIQSQATARIGGTVTMEANGTGDKSNELSVQAGKLYLDSGANVTVNRFITSDGTSNNKPSEVHIAAGANLTITGTTDTGDATASFQLCRWNSSTALFSMTGGTVTSNGALMRVTNNGQSTVVISGGELNVKGITFGRNSTSSTTGTPSIKFYLGAIDSGAGNAVINIGASGIQGLAIQAVSNLTPELNLGQGTIRATADWSTNTGGDVNINMVSAAGTTFDPNGHTITINHSLAGSGNMIVTGAGKLVLAAPSSSYTGAMTVTGGGTLDFGGNAYSNQINMQSGTIANAGSTTGNIGIQASGNVDLGGAQGSRVNSLANTAVGVTISGINGNITLGSASLQLGLGNLTSATDPTVSGSALVQFNNAASQLNLDSLALDIGDTSLTSFLNGATDIFYFEITNGILGGNIASDPQTNISFNPYLATLGFTVDSVSGGRVVIRNIGGSDYFLVAEGTTRSVDIANLIDPYSSVIVEGTLNINLQNGESITLNALAGNVAAGVINTGSNSGVTVELNNSNIDFAPGTSYAGSITGSAALVKTGQYDLTVRGKVEASSLTIAGGKLTLQGGGTIQGMTDVGANNTLNLQGGTLSTGSIQMVADSTIDMAGSTLALTGGGTTNTIVANSNLTGNGTISLGEGVALDIELGANVSDDVGISTNSGNWTVGTSEDTTFNSLIGNGQLNIRNNAVISLAGGQDSEFNGTINGSGSLIKYGTATQTLNTILNPGIDVSSLGGNLVLNKGGDTGMLIVGSPSTRALNVPDKAKLTITQNTAASGLLVYGNGTLSVGGLDGSTPATLTLSGNGTFQSGATVEMVVPNSAGVINTSGTISLPNQMNLNFVNSILNDVASMQEMVLMKAGLGFLDESGNSIANGTAFDSWTINMPGTMKLFYSAHAYIGDNGNALMANATANQNNALLPIAQSGNAEAGARLLWAAGVQPSGTTLDTLLESIIADTDAGDTAAANQKMAAAVGSTYTGLLSALQSDFRSQQTLIRNRVNSIGMNQDVYSRGDVPLYNAWVQVNGAYNKLDSRGHDAGYKLDTWGATVGFDMDLSESFTIGTALTASFGDFSSDAADHAEGDLDSYYLNLFARYQHKRWAHVLILTGGWSTADIDRTVSYGSGSYKTHGKTDGASYGAMYELTYDIALNKKKTVLFQPLANASIMNTRFDSFSESGAGNANLHVSGMNETIGTLGLGGRLLGEIGSNAFGREAIGTLRVQVAQDIGTEYNKANVAFEANTAYGQQIRGSKIGRTAVQIGAGLNIPVSYESSIFFDANVDLRSKATSVNGSLGYRYNF